MSIGNALKQTARVLGLGVLGLLSLPFAAAGAVIMFGGLVVNVTNLVLTGIGACTVCCAPCTVCCVTAPLGLVSEALFRLGAGLILPAALVGSALCGESNGNLDWQERHRVLAHACRIPVGAHQAERNEESFVQHVAQPSPVPAVGYAAANPGLSEYRPVMVPSYQAAMAEAEAPAPVFAMSLDPAANSGPNMLSPRRAAPHS